MNKALAAAYLAPEYNFEVHSRLANLWEAATELNRMNNWHLSAVAIQRRTPRSIGQSELASVLGSRHSRCRSYRRDRSCSIPGLLVEIRWQSMHSPDLRSNWRLVWPCQSPKTWELPSDRNIARLVGPQPRVLQLRLVELVPWRWSTLRGRSLLRICSGERAGDRRRPKQAQVRLAR